MNCKWVILLNLVHSGNLQFLAIFHNLAANLDLGVFIDILLVLGKNPCSLAAKL